MKIEKINELDMKLLEKHDENIFEYILNRLDNLINLINDDEFLLMFLKPDKDYSTDGIFESLLFYRITGDSGRQRYIIRHHKDKRYLLYIDEFLKFEKRIKEIYLRRLEEFQ